MAGYRRFIAYVYEYRKGKKSGNCGFIKVEVREERCSIEVHLHCEGITPQTECKVFGFVRKDGLINGILLGSCETQDDIVECLIETDSMNMAESGVALGKMGGMIFLTESGGFFGTEWDDQPIRTENFKELPVSELPGKMLEKQRDFSQAGTDETEKMTEENEGYSIERQDGGDQEKTGKEENDKKNDQEYAEPGNKEMDRDYVESGSKEESGDFTERELEVLRIMTTGTSNSAIAEELGISENTVKNHIRHMMEKTGCESRTELAIEARVSGVVISTRKNSTFVSCEIGKSGL